MNQYHIRKYNIKFEPYSINNKQWDMYIDSEEQMITFICPCGCGKKFQLNTDMEIEPLWQYRINVNGEINIHPSVQRIGGCESHFWIRDNRVVWC